MADIIKREDKESETVDYCPVSEAAKEWFNSRIYVRWQTHYPFDLSAGPMIDADLAEAGLTIETQP